MGGVGAFILSPTFPLLRASRASRGAVPPVRSQHFGLSERSQGNRAAEMRGREGSNPGPRLWYHVSAPHLANPTIKPRCYSGRGGGLYPQSNIPPTVCEPDVARSRSSARRSPQQVSAHKRRRGNRAAEIAWPGGIEPRTSALVPS